MTRPVIDVATLRTWLTDGAELAVLDLRDPVAFGKGAPLYATNLPAGQVETDIDRLIPRVAVRTVLVDGDGRSAPDIAERLHRQGRNAAVALDGGLAAWAGDGGIPQPVFAIPGLTFALGVLSEAGTPVLTATELDALRARGQPVAVLDCRTVPEFVDAHVPGAVSVPGAELLLRFTDVVTSPETLVVVSCAGLPRAIIGAQTLIDAGVPNPVAYLHEGTQGWRAAGLALESGRTLADGPVGTAGRRRAEIWASGLGKADPVRRIDLPMALAWRQDPARTTYLLDLRAPEAFADAPVEGAISAEGGQLLAVPSRVIAVRGARVVLIDDPSGARAAVTAHWLVRHGFEIALLLHDFAAAPAGAVA